jgi:amino acid transporter
MWTFTGFDASAHVSEETHDPRRRAPWGMVSAVLVSAVCGYALVVALTLAVPDVASAAAAEQPPLFVMKAALGEQAGRAAMGLGIGAMWFCGLSSVTSASRMIFAFARDGGLPRRLREVSARHRTPAVAIIVASVLPLALVLVTMPFSEAAFLTVASLATTGLYVSYTVPIVLGALARHAGRWRTRGPWNLGALGIPVAWAAAAWTLFVLGVCSLPPNATAGPAVVGVALVLGAVYVTFVRGRFTGPKIALSDWEKS